LPDDEDAQGMQEYRRGELMFDVMTLALSMGRWWRCCTAFRAGI
jgi:hypothetical protein